MLKAALIAIMGLGFGTAAEAQTLEARLAGVIEACPEAEIRSAPTSISGPYRRLVGGQRYLHNPCDLETNENPILLRAIYDWTNGGTYGTSTSARNVARHMMNNVPFDERYGEYVELARRMGRENLLPREGNTRFRNLAPLN